MPRLRPATLLLLALLSAGALTGCSRKTGQRSAPRVIANTYVRVTNQSWLDMNVYVLQGSQRIRLGMVNSNATTRLQLPKGMVFGATVLSFVVDPIGSRRTATSFEISVSPGDEVQLTIPATVR